MTGAFHISEEGAPDPADALLVEAAAIYARPQFSAAVRHYTTALAGFRERSRLTNKLMAYEARFRTVGYLLYLYAENATSGDGLGVSYGTLYDLCVRRGEVGPRTTKTMLALLDLAGFVASARSAADRRIKLYRPTDKMLDFARAWFGHSAATLDVLEPEAQRSARLRSDRAYLLAFLVSAGREHAGERPPADRMPDFIGYFGAMEGAAAVVSAVSLADIDGVAAPSRAALARQFGLSKTQVSKVIEAGVGQGWFGLDASAAPLVTDRLRRAYRRWISIELAFYARHLSAA